METLSRLAIWKERGKVAALFTSCALMAVFAVQVMIQPKLLGSAAGAAVHPLLSETTGTLKDTRASVATVRDLLAEIKSDYLKNQENVAANSEAVASLLYEMNAMVKDSRIQLFGGPWGCKDSGRKTAGGNKVYDCEQIPGLLPQTNGLVADIRGWIPSLKIDIHDLMVAGKGVLESTDADLKELKNELIKLGKIEDSLDQTLKDSGKEAVELVKKAEASIDHVNALLADPRISGIVDNLNHTTYHFGEIAETTDIATRDLRKQVGRVKWLIKTISSYLKATIALY